MALQVNKAILIGALGITATGVVVAVTKQKPITPVIMGGYVLCLVASIADLAGGEISRLMGDIVLAALFGVVLTELPWDTLLGLVNGQGAQTPASNPPPPAPGQGTHQPF